MPGFPRNLLLSAALAMAGGAVSASTMPVVTIGAFDRSGYDAAMTALDRSVVEDFEAFMSGEITGGLTTAVGVFDTLGGTGSGNTVSGTAGNTGTGVFLRDRRTSGRSNTTAGQKSDTFLDSNDTYGLSWTIAGLGMFDHVFFTLSDVADTGATFAILADGVQLGPSLSKKNNGAIDMVMLSFGTAVDKLTLQLRNSRLNDGFAIDDAGIGLKRLAAQTPAPVPIPPAAALLVGGIAALALFRRRRA